MKTMVRSTLCLLSIACFALVVRAGVVIQQEGGEIGGSQPKQKMTLYLDAGKMRVDISDPAGKKSAMIFDADKQVMWMIDSAGGSYTEITAAQVQQMANQMSGMMAQMQAQLAQLPPEQRAKVEEMMKGRMGAGGGGAAPTITVQQKGSGEKVGQFATNHYDVLSNGQRTQEIWAAAKDQAHIQDDLLQTFKAMAKFYEPLSRNAPRGAWSAPSALMEQISGFPVKTIMYDGPRATSEWDVISIESRSLEGGLFTLPAGLKKTEMPGMGGPRRGQ